MPNYTCATCGERITTKAEEDWHIYTHLQAFNGSDYSAKIAEASAQIRQEREQRGR